MFASKNCCQFVGAWQCQLFIDLAHENKDRHPVWCEFLVYEMLQCIWTQYREDCNFLYIIVHDGFFNGSYHHFELFPAA